VAAAVVLAAVVQIWGPHQTGADARRAALYAAGGSDPSAGINVRCSFDGTVPRALIGQAVYHCTVGPCPGERGKWGGVSITVRHSVFGGWWKRADWDRPGIPTSGGSIDKQDWEMANSRNTCGP
jgi:hypothetical protein